MSVRQASLLLALILTAGLPSWAQETTSELQGIILSENNQPLVGATVTAVHLPTGTRYTTQARNDGRYSLPNVRVGGPYEVIATYVGYQTATQKDISLVLGTAYKADFTLTSSAGSLAEVVVAGSRSDKVFSRSRTGAAEVITRTQIDRLPTINRSLQDYTRLTPSANGNSFAGRSGSYNNLTVNGAAFNNTFGLSGTLGGQTASQPISLDALDQIQVNIAPYDVTLGSFTGAGINSVTRSGTNTFRGSVYNYWKNPDLTGTKAGPVELARQQFDFSNRGFNLGGYFVKNKLFFFVSGEQERLSQPATTFTASRAGAPPVPGAVSQANADSLNRLRQFLISKYNYDPGDFENYNLETKSDKLTVRLDYNINSKHTFNVNYFYLKSSRNVPASNSGAPGNNRQPGNFGLPFFASTYVINNNFNILIAELNSRFSNGIANKLQAGFTQLRDFRTSPGGLFPLVDILNPATNQTYTSFGYEPFTAFNQLNTDTWQFNDIVTLSRGKHNFTIGTQNTLNQFVNNFAPNYYGAYVFPSLTAFYNSANSNTPTAARYQLRYSARKDGEFPSANLSALQLGFFAQDRWNVTKNFTLTAGLRADLPIFEDKFTANAVADSLVFRNGARLTTGEQPKTAVLWSPRAGFNWDVTGDKRTQVRGGLGIFAGAPPFVWISNQASNNGIDFGSIDLQPGVGGIVQSDPRLIFQPNVDANRPVNAAANTFYNLAVTDKDFKFPQIFRTNVAVDKKIFADITATLEATYTRDLNAVYHQNVNLPATGTALAGADNRIRYTSAKIYSGAGGRSLRNPDITDAILMRNTNKGYSYNVTLQLQRNVNNLYTMVAYTYGQSKSVNDGGSIAQSIWRDRPVSGDPNADVLSYSNFNQPHRVVAAGFYRKEYAKYFATSIGLTFEAANGGTASYIYNGDVNNDGLNNNDLIYIPKDASEILLEPAGASDPRTPAVLWSQLDAYIRQDPYLSARRGQYAERNGLLLPFYKRLDLNFTQDLKIKAGKTSHTLRFTADIFNFGNLLNRNWGTFRTTNRTQLLTLSPTPIATTGPNANRPVYRFPFQDAASQTPLQSTFQNSTGPGSRYQIQMGLRYLFN